MTGGADPPPRAFSNPILAAIRLGLILVLTMGAATLLRIANRRERPAQACAASALQWVHRWCRACVRVLGIRIVTCGPDPPSHALLTPNHLGYCDVFALGAALPTFFVPSTEVMRWPVIGPLMRISLQIAVDRQSKHALRGAIELLGSRLRMGHRVTAFLEGTSTGGDRVLPFRAPLVQSVLDADAVLVPVTLRWRADNPAVDIAEDVAYWKDHRFGPHFWRFLGLRGLTAEITFHPSLANDGQDRKSLAALAHSLVESRLLG